MTLLFFWLKIGAGRIINLTKHSPVVIIGFGIIIAAFIIARNDIARMMDLQSEIVTLLFFVSVSLLLSLRNYHTMPWSMIYAKSGLRNKHIRFWFFVKQALANNTLFILFGLVSLMGFIQIERFMALPAAFLLSLLLSFSIMYLKNEYHSKHINKKTERKPGLNPVTKSAIYDYFSSGFLQMAVISIGLFGAIMVLLTGNIKYIHELENPSIILTGISIALFIGFMGLIESVHGINWKFHSIIYPRDFIYHLKRTIRAAGVFFGLQIAILIFTALFFGLPLVLKYLYCTLVMLLLSIHIAFMVSGQLTKAITLFIAAAFTLWISTLQAAFLFVLAAPVLLTFFRANSEYREWYYL